MTESTSRPWRRPRVRTADTSSDGGSSAAAVAAIEAIVEEVNLFYERDALITHVLTDVVIRTAPFYTPTSGGDLLDQFVAEWNTNLTGIPRDIRT